MVASREFGPSIIIGESFLLFFASLTYAFNSFPDQAIKIKSLYEY